MGTQRKSRVEFTPNQDAVIRELYPDNGSQYCQKYLPELTHDQISHRAWHLGLRLEKHVTRRIRAEALRNATRKNRIVKRINPLDNWTTQVLCRPWRSTREGAGEIIVGDPVPAYHPRDKKP